MLRDAFQSADIIQQVRWYYKSQQNAAVGRLHVPCCERQAI